MQRGIIYFIAGTVVSFLLNFYLLESEGWQLDLYYAVAFGAACGTSYILDTEKLRLPQKLGLSFLVMALLLGAGAWFFGLEKAVPAVIKFSVVFVAYYLIASLRTTKSLRK